MYLVDYFAVASNVLSGIQGVWDKFDIVLRKKEFLKELGVDCLILPPLCFIFYFNFSYVSSNSV